MLLDAKKAAQKAAAKFGTTNPFQIAGELGYVVLEVPLEGVRGFHLYTKRRHIIYISDVLNEWEKLWVCAHELGHALLHKDMTHGSHLFSRFLQDVCMLLEGLHGSRDIL